MWNGFLYSVALHAQGGTVALHDVSFDGLTYWIFFTTTPARSREFIESVAHDLGGFLSAYTGDEELEILLEPPIAIDELPAPAGAAETL